MRNSTLRQLGLACALFAICFSSEAQTTDNPHNAVSLDGTNAFIQLPNVSWFGANFTLEGWVYLRTYSDNATMFDLGNGPNNDNVRLALTGTNSQGPTAVVFNGSNGIPTLTAPAQLPLRQWTHVALTLNNSNATIYINGEIAATNTLNAPTVVSRTGYVGRSNF